VETNKRRNREIMTPKEKAKELVDKYFKYLNYEFGDMVYSLRDKYPQQCALIAIEQIVEHVNELDDSEWYLSTKEYIYNVKQEIIASEEDAKIFIDAIENPPAPNEKLKKAIKEIKPEDIFNNEKRQGVKDLIDKHKQETLEDNELKIPSKFCIPHKHYISDDDKICYETGYRDGIKYQQEQDKNKFSEEEVLKFTQTILMQYKFGNTDIEQMDLLRETFQLFKNK
jgi:hypothetical protein